MPDPYPCFLEGRHAAVPIEKVGEFIRACHGAGTGVKAIWVTPQAFNYGDYGKRNNRAPDFTELRNMTYQSALYGVTGFIYYTWSHSQNYMDLQVGMPYLAQEIADLEEAILAPAAEGVVRVVADVPEHLHSSARRVGEDVVILAVNTSTEAQRAAFEFAAGPPSELHVISENRVLAAGQDGAFADAFGPYATHLYTTDEALAARTTLAEAQAEIEARDLARRKPGNLAFEENGTVVTASSSARFSSSKDRVVDGVAGGMAWRDGTPNETPDWLEITWPGPVEIARVVVHSETIERVAVLVPNESGWGQVAEGSGADLAEISLVFPKVSTDRLRVEVRKNTAGAAIAIVTEIEAYSD